MLQLATSPRKTFISQKWNDEPKLPLKKLLEKLLMHSKISILILSSFSTVPKKKKRKKERKKKKRKWNEFFKKVHV